MCISLPPLQLSWLIDFRFVPNWLGPTIVFFGSEFILIGAIKTALSEQIDYWHDFHQRKQKSIIAGLVVGILALASAVIQTYDLLTPYGIFWFALGRILEGVATIRLYQRIERYFWGDGSSARFSSVFSSIRHRLLSVFVIMIAIYFIIEILKSGPFIYTSRYDIALVITGLIVTLTSLATRRKMRVVRDDFPQEIILGYFLCIAGAEIFNLSITGDIVSFIVGDIAYSIGFWYGAYVWVWK